MSFAGSEFAGRVSLCPGPPCNLAAHTASTAAASTRMPSSTQKPSLFLVPYQCDIITMLRVCANFQLVDAYWSSTNSATHSRNDKPFQLIGSRAYWWGRSSGIGPRVRVPILARSEVEQAFDFSSKFLTLVNWSHLINFLAVRYGFCKQRFCCFSS